MTLCRNFLIGLFSDSLPALVPESTELVDWMIGADVVPFPSLNAELRRIMIVLVWGNLRLCSRNPSSLKLLLVFDFLIVVCIRPSRGGNGGGLISRGGSCGASGACLFWAKFTASDSFRSRLRGGKGGAT